MSGKDVRYLPENAIAQIADFNSFLEDLPEGKAKNLVKTKYELAVRRQVTDG